MMKRMTNEERLKRWQMDMWLRINSLTMRLPDGFSKANESTLKQIEDLCLLVREVNGHWILLDECANSGYYCSNCQKKLVKEGWSQTVKKIKYCPNCGAKMEEDK